MTVPLYELLADDLSALGVEIVFGLASDDTLGLVSSLEPRGIAFVGARHETQAVVMAEGYGWVTGRLGVALVGRGPAATNALSGSVLASRTGSKVLIVLGDDPVVAGGHGPDMKAVGHAGAAEAFSAAGIRSFRATAPSVARGLLADAAAHAGLGNAASLHLPTDVQHACVDPASAVSMIVAAAPQSNPVGADRAALDAAIAVLAGSERPLIIAGWGVHRANARDAVERIADRLGAIVVTTLRAKDMFADYAFGAGVIGSLSHSVARGLIEQADGVLAIGAGLNALTTGYGRAIPDVPVVHVDANGSQIGRWHPVRVPVVGDAKAVAEELLAALPVSAAVRPYHSDETRKALADFRLADDFSDLSTDRMVDPRTLALELDSMLPPLRTIVYDGGNSLLAAAYLTVPAPDYIKTCSDSGSIGLAFGTAIGVATGRPHATTVLFVGDGALLMSLSELETVPRLGIPLVVIVMNDHAYGAERHIAEASKLSAATSLFPEVDYAALAASLGYAAYAIGSLDDLRGLADVIAAPSGPLLLDCRIDGSVCAPFIAELFPMDA